jgi:hypothetical protein
MSDHGHAAQAAHAESGDGHDYQFHGEPADRPGPDEPKTPGWFPLLGIGLVLAGILGFILMQPDEKTRAELAEAVPPAESVAAAAAPAPEAAPAPAERRPPRALPSGLRPNVMPLASGATPRRPGPFAMPAGSARALPPGHPPTPAHPPHPGHENH